MHFAIDPHTEDLRQRIRRFLDTHVTPIELDLSHRDEHDNLKESTLADLRARARADGLWALQMPRARGGQELKVADMAVCYEEAGTSPFGAQIFNVAAPDDGNMLVLNKALTETQKDRWLQPIINGEVRSAFAMTEPDGCGSDPGLTYTTAEPRGTDWLIRGRKWFITGAESAQHFIVIARTSDDERKGLTAFLFDRSAPGWRIERRIPIMGPEEHGGHCEMVFDDLVIPDSQRILKVGDGLKVTQMRLGIARLTHCMRWLGLGRRSLAIASDYIARRQSFGMPLANHEGVQWMLGEAAMQLRVGRLLTQHAAWKIDQGGFARPEVSMAKIQVADALHKAVDTAIQLCGARGYSRDTLLEWIYRYARQARLVDGASEIHKMVLARTLLSEPDDFFGWQ